MLLPLAVAPALPAPRQEGEGTQTAPSPTLGAACDEARQARFSRARRTRVAPSRPQASVPPLVRTSHGRRTARVGHAWHRSCPVLPRPPHANAKRPRSPFPRFEVARLGKGVFFARADSPTGVFWWLRGPSAAGLCSFSRSQSLCSPSPSPRIRSDAEVALALLGQSIGQDAWMVLFLVHGDGTSCILGEL